MKDPMTLREIAQVVLSVPLGIAAIYILWALTVALG